MVTNILFNVVCVIGIIVLCVLIAFGKALDVFDKAVNYLEKFCKRLGWEKKKK